MGLFRSKYWSFIACLLKTSGFRPVSYTHLDVYKRQAYNLIALPVAAMGWVTPWLAALGMALSSLIVTVNALRLTRTPRSLAP